MSRNDEIVRYILEECEEQGISKRKMAETIGCSLRTFNYWLRGERGMSIDMADKALKVLGVTYEIGNKSNENDRRKL